MADEFLPPVVAKLAIDISDFLSGLDQAKAALASFAAEAATVGDIKLKVDADTSGLRGEVDRAAKEAEAGEEITVPVKADAVDLDRLQQTGEKITIPVEVDDLAATAKLAEIKHEADDLSGRQIVLDVDVRGADVGAERLKLLGLASETSQAKLAALGDSTLDITQKAQPLRTALSDLDAKVYDTGYTAEGAAERLKLLGITSQFSREGLRALGDDTVYATSKLAGLNAGSVEWARGLQASARDVKTVLESDVSAPAEKMAADWAADFEKMRAQTQRVSDDMASRTRLVEAAWRDVDNAIVDDAEKAGGKAGDGFAKSFLARTVDINPGGGVFRVPVELIIPAIADLGQLTGILGLIPALFAGAATAAGTFAVGINDVSDAEKAYQAIEKQSDEQAAKTAATYAQQLSTTNSIINAQNAVTDATRAYADAQRKASEDVAKAQQDVQNATQSLADAQRTTANDIINATQAVARAKQDEARAEQTAAQNNENALQAEQRAEEQLANAQQAATRAQLALTDAREAASRSIEDLQHRVADDALSVQAATLNIQQAQVDLNKTLIDPTATQLQREQAQLNYQQQVQQLSDIQLQYQRAQEDAAKASAAGVDGSQQVINAQDSLTQAQQRVSDATNAVGEAQEKIVTTQQAGAQAIADAQQKVADSERALTNAQIDGAQRVQKAQQALADAELKLNDTRISSTESVSKALEQEESAQRALNVALAQQKAQVEANNSAQAAYQVALDKLAPSARDAVTAFNDLAGEDSPFEDLHLDVQQRMFAGVGDEIRRIADADLPVLRTGMDGMADDINRGFHAIGDFLTAPSSASDWEEIFHNIDTAAGDLTGSLQPILSIFTDLVAVGSEFLPGLADDFTHGAQSVADFVHNARETGKLHEWIQEGLDTFQKLWGIVKDLAVILKTLFAGGDFGLLTIAKNLLDILAWISDHAPWLLYFIEGFFLVSRVKSFVDTLKTVYDTFSSIYDKVSSLVVKVGEWLTGSKGAADATTQAARDAETAYGDTAVAAEGSRTRIATADAEAGAAAEAERDVTRRAAVETETAYADTAVAAEASRDRVVTADLEAGAAAEAEGAAGAGGAAAGGLAKGALGLLGPIGAVVGGTLLANDLTGGKLSEEINKITGGNLALSHSPNLKNLFIAPPPTPGDKNDVRNLPQTLSNVTSAAATQVKPIPGVEKAASIPPAATPNDVRNLPKTVTDAMHNTGAGVDAASPTMSQKMKNAWDSFVNFGPGKLGHAMGVGLGSALSAMSQVIPTISHALTDFGSNVIQPFFTKTVPDAIKTAGPAVYHALSDFGKNNLEPFFTKTIPSWGSSIYQALSDVGEHNIKPFFTQTLPSIIHPSDQFFKSGHDVGAGFWNGVKDFFGNLGGQIGGLVGGFVQGFKDHFKMSSPSQVMHDVGWNVAIGLINGVIDAAGSFGGTIFNIGQSLVIGLWNGFANWTGEFVNRVWTWLGNVWTNIKNFFGIRSPSTLMATAGQSIAEGLAIGIQDNTHLAVNAALSMAQQVSGTMTDIKAPSFDFANTVPFIPDVGALPGGNVSLALGGAPAPLTVTASGQSNQPPVIQVTVQGNVWTEQELFSRLQTLTQQHSNRNPATGFVQYGFGTGR